MTEMIPFDIAGSGCRFGQDDDGTPWVVASDYAKAMGYRDAANALRLLDDGEKGTQIVSTPGGQQNVSVIYEDGMWELIFRSTLPGARAIKARVKSILREIRETGRHEVQPMTELEMAERYVIALKRNAVLEPKAEAYDSFMTADGDYLIGTVAKMLGLGPNTLFARLRDEHVLISGGKRHNTPQQQYMKHFRVVSRTFTDGDGAVHARYTTYVRPTGVDWLRKVLKLVQHDQV